MGGIFGGSPEPVVIPEPTPAPPKRDDAAVQRAAEEARRRARLAEGRASTILTDVDLELDPVRGSKGRKKTLLGGN